MTSSAEWICASEIVEENQGENLWERASGAICRHAHIFWKANLHGASHHPWDDSQLETETSKKLCNFMLKYTTTWLEQVQLEQVQHVQKLQNKPARCISN